MKFTNHSRGIYRIYPNLTKENRRMSTCNQLDLQTLGSQPVVMPQNLRDHWHQLLRNTPGSCGVESLSWWWNISCNVSHRMMTIILGQNGLDSRTIILEQKVSWIRTVILGRREYQIIIRAQIQHEFVFHFYILGLTSGIWTNPSKCLKR